ncbi:MAG: B12-binding domain-containing protein [Planctomycetaceae bacterium]|nr:B12-binding domain-containing protein [Planctomycetaceae bacterium]
MKDLVSPKQVAQAIGVSESSLKRWCDQGLIPAIKTAGGHRRLAVNGVLAYLRRTGHPIVDPEILGLPPATTGGADRKLAGERERFLEALIGGDEALCVQIVLNLYLADHAMSRICDEVLASAFAEIGNRWGCGDLAVYQERRSCELCHRVMHEVRRALPELPSEAPIAVGGTLDGDPYTLASSMVELVLRDLGWRAASLGNMLPFSTLRAALCDTCPRLFWLSISSIRDLDSFYEQFADLWELTQDNGVALAVGGKALTEDVRRQIHYSAFCDTFEHLASFARTLHPMRSANAG